MTRTKYHQTTLTLLCTALLLPALAWAQQKNVGDLADDFELIDVPTGQTVKLSDFAGSIIVLDFFSYW